MLATSHGIGGDSRMVLLGWVRCSDEAIAVRGFVDWPEDGIGQEGTVDEGDEDQWAMEAVRR